MGAVMKQPKEQLQEGGLGPARKRRFARPRRTWLRLLAVACIVGIVVAAGAFVPELVARRWLAARLADAGVSAAGLDSLQMDLVDQRAWIGPVTLAGGDGSRLRLQSAELRLDPEALLDRHVEIADLTVRGADITIGHDADGRRTLAGLPLDALPERMTAALSGGGWPLGFAAVAMEDARITMAGAGADAPPLRLKRVTLRDLRGWERDRPAALGLLGRLGDGAVTVDGNLRDDGGGWTADLHAVLSSVTLPPPLTADAAPWDADLRVRLHAGADDRIAGSAVGHVRTDRLTLTDADTRLHLERFTGNVDLAVSAPGDAAARITGSATMAVERVRLEGPIVVATAAASARLPAIDITVAGDGADIALRLDADLSRVSATMPADSAAPVLLSARSVRVAHMAVRRARGESGEASVERVTVHGPNVRVPLARLAAAFAAEPRAPSVPAVAVRIGRVDLAGDGHAVLVDADDTPLADLDVSSADISGIDTAAARSAAAFGLAGRVGAFPVIAQGQAVLADPGNTFAAAFTVSRTPLTALAARALREGIAIAGGAAWACGQAAVRRGQLDGEMTVTLDHPDLLPLTPEDADALTAWLGRPRAAVVALLTDPEDRLTVRLPVAGAVASPGLDVPAAIAAAVAAHWGAALPPETWRSDAWPLVLPPLVPDGGDGHLTAHATALLDALASAMADRPRAALLVCGSAPPATPPADGFTRIVVDRLVATAPAVAGRVIVCGKPGDGEASPTARLALISAGGITTSVQ